MRVSEKCQKYRYAKKTQISLDPKKCRYVGEIATFDANQTPVIQFLGKCRFVK